jgi:hypothetical protein
MPADPRMDRTVDRVHERLKRYHETFPFSQVHELPIDRAAHERMPLAIGGDHVVNLFASDMRALFEADFESQMLRAVKAESVKEGAAAQPGRADQEQDRITAAVDCIKDTCWHAFSLVDDHEQRRTLGAMMAFNARRFIGGKTDHRAAGRQPDFAREKLPVHQVRVPVSVQSAHQLAIQLTRVRGG